MTGLTASTIVVPVDFSEESIAALDTALEITDHPSQVHAVHVLPDLNPAEPGVLWKKVDKEERQKHATQALRDCLGDARYEPVQLVIEIGDPGHCIAAFAASVKADLIVTPSHGRTGLKRFPIGSVAERVVRLAHCPVLVLRQ